MPFYERFAKKGFETWEEITVERFNTDGLPVIRELGKDLISMSPRWVHLIFAVQHWAHGKWDEPAILFTTWERKNHRWIVKTKYKIDHRKVRKILATLAHWLSKLDSMIAAADNKPRKKPSKLDTLLAVNAEAWSDRLTGS